MTTLSQASHNWGIWTLWAAADPVHPPGCWSQLFADAFSIIQLSWYILIPWKFLQPPKEVSKKAEKRLPIVEVPWFLVQITREWPASDVPRRHLDFSAGRDCEELVSINLCCARRYQTIRVLDQPEIWCQLRNTYVYIKAITAINICVLYLNSSYLCQMINHNRHCLHT